MSLADVILNHTGRSPQVFHLIILLKLNIMAKKILKEKICMHCHTNRHCLHFRFIENSIVYYWEKCLQCKHSRRGNMTIDAWKVATQVSDDLQDITKHHRKMRCHNGGNEEANISYVPRKKHQAFHTLFGNMTTAQIAKYLNEVWLDPAWSIIATKKQFSKTIKMYPYEPVINVGDRR